MQQLDFFLLETMAVALFNIQKRTNMFTPDPA